MAKTTQERIDSVMQRWNSGLNLSPDQKARLLTIVTARENEQQQVRKQHKGEANKETKMAKVKEIRKKHGPAMKAVLNKDQSKQLKELRKQWKAARAK